MNVVVISGTITRNIWQYGGDTLFRLGHNGHFFTIRVRGLPVQLEPGVRVVVSGTLTSREEDVSLADFARRAEGGTGEVDRETLERIGNALGREHRSYTEILAEKIRALA